MSYFTDDSEQCVSWKKLQGPPKKDDFTSEILSLSAQYEALRVWGEYVKSQGALEREQAVNLVETVVGGWIILQVANHIDLGVNVDHKAAQGEATKGALDALTDAMKEKEKA